VCNWSSHLVIPGQTMAMVKDCELLKLVQCGDQQALVALYDRYSRLVYAVSLRVLKDPISAEDVSQEIFMQLWRSPEQASILGKTLHGWLIIASRNRSISLLRKKCPGSLDDLTLASPFNLEKHSERRLMCEKLVNELPLAQRMVLEMAYLKEMSHSEIATATGYPLGTIKTRIRSALKVLRKALPPRLTTSPRLARQAVPVPIEGPQSPIPLASVL
jgi:RNA polymerase sigma-70 factor, ECF subfamily